MNQSPTANPDKFLTADKVILLISLVTYGMGQSVLFVVFPPLAWSFRSQTLCWLPAPCSGAG
jgi:hypothetical protein